MVSVSCVVPLVRLLCCSLSWVLPKADLRYERPPA